MFPHRDVLDVRAVDAPTGKYAIVGLGAYGLVIPATAAVIAGLSLPHRNHAGFVSKLSRQSKAAQTLLSETTMPSHRAL